MLDSGEIGLFSVSRLVQAQLIVLPSAHTCTGECIALGYHLQNHNIADIVIMNLIVVSNVEFVIGYSFDIGGGWKQQIS